MESAKENARLLSQEQLLPARPILEATGLRLGMAMLDAGCGPGGVTAEALGIVGPSGSVLGIDLSPERIAAAQSLWAGNGNLRFEVADIRKLPAATSSFDYVWSQFVFEYLPKPEEALDELVRVCRPGGRVVVTEIDGFGLSYWPQTPSLDEGIAKLRRALELARFDLFVGRKLFSLFQAKGLRDIRMHLHPFYVIAGAASQHWLVDWETRFTSLQPAALPVFGDLESYQRFCTEYLAMMRDDGTFKYGVRLVAEGTRG
jgi:ubiquinone/menaquinone biosynthesis C-methylase UbiE